VVNGLDMTGWETSEPVDFVVLVGVSRRKCAQLISNPIQSIKTLLCLPNAMLYTIEVRSIIHGRSQSSAVRKNMPFGVCSAQGENPVRGYLSLNPSLLQRRLFALTRRRNASRRHELTRRLLHLHLLLHLRLHLIIGIRQHPRHSKQQRAGTQHP